MAKKQDLQRSETNRVERRKKKKIPPWRGKRCLCKDRQRFSRPKVSRENLEREKNKIKSKVYYSIVRKII